MTSDPKSANPDEQDKAAFESALLLFHAKVADDDSISRMADQILVEILESVLADRPDLATDPDALADEAVARWKVTAKK
jgi:hypothetical protein